MNEVAFGTENIDLSAVEQIVNPGKLRAIAEALIVAKEKYVDDKRSLSQILDKILEDIDSQGLDILTKYPQGDLAKFRRFELAAALNRLRSLAIDL